MEERQEQEEGRKMLMFWFALGLLVLCLIEDKPWFNRWAARMIARIVRR